VQSVRIGIALALLLALGWGLSHAETEACPFGFSPIVLNGEPANGNFTSDSANNVYFTAPLEGQRSTRRIYWIDGREVKPVTDSDGKVFEGSYMGLQTNGVRAFASPTERGRRLLYVLDKGQIQPVRTPNGGQLSASRGWTLHGPEQEIAQEEETLSFFRLNGAVATPIEFAVRPPEMRNPRLIVTKDRLYLLQASTLAFPVPGGSRLWEITNRGNLEPVTYESGEEVRLGVAIFRNVGAQTLAAIENEDEDYFLWRLSDRKLSLVYDDEDDPVHVPDAFFGRTHVDGGMYVTGWSRSHEGYLVWWVPAEGKATLVMAGDKPLSADDYRFYSAGHSALIRCYDEDGDTLDVWIARGNRATRATREGKPLQGTPNWIHAVGQDVLFGLEKAAGQHELLRIDTNARAFPVADDKGRPIVGTQHLMMGAFRIHVVGRDVYCFRREGEASVSILHARLK